ncbi:MAG: hypothetical protein AAGB01_00995 [Cyanobacteria bacterium P01_F01_bin.42]
MSDYIFILFLGFSAIWILLAILAVYWVMRLEKRAFKISKEMLVVSLSILIPFIIALIFGALNL